MQEAPSHDHSPTPNRRRGWLRFGAALLLVAAGTAAGAFLTLDDIVRDGEGGVVGLGGVVSVATSPDGGQLYAVGSTSDALAVFDVEPGGLTFVESFVDDVDGVFGLIMPSAVTSSPDCRHVFVASEVDDMVTVYQRQAEPSQDAVFGVGLDVPVCASSTRGCESGSLLEGRGAIQSEPNQPNTLDGCADGETGTGIAFMDDYIFGIRVRTLNGAELAEGSRVGVQVSFFVATDPADLYVDIYSAADAENPSWNLVDTMQPVGLGFQLVTSDYTLPAGGLQAVRAQLRFQGTATPCTLGATNDHDDLAFSVDPGPPALCPQTSDLTFIAAQAKENLVDQVTGLDGPSGLAVSADGMNLYVTARESHSLVVFERLLAMEEMNYVETHFDGAAGLQGAAAVALSPDDAHVYVASEISGVIAVFERDPADGTLTFLSQSDGGGSLDGATSVAVSADGQHVYAAAKLSNALVAFDRDPVTGALTQNATYIDGAGGLDGLAGASWVGLDPTGLRVLVASPGDDAVAVFRRTPATGALAQLDVLADGVGGADGLAGAIALAIAGDEVFTAAQNEDAVARYDLPACMGTELLGDSDLDAICDDFDTCQGDDLTGDDDSDLVCNDLDACPGFDDSVDTDADGSADGCDLCEGDDASGDPDGDLVCTDLDCAPLDGGVSQLDACGVCGGDGGCVLFFDGFESGGVGAWTGVG